MANLPVITAFGGINPAGRASGHHAYRRMVVDVLDDKKRDSTWTSLAALTGKLSKSDSGWLNADGKSVELIKAISALAPNLNQSTLIRKLEANLFDPSRLLFHQSASLTGTNLQPLEFEILKKHLPSPLPSGWIVKESSSEPEHKLIVSVAENFEVLMKSFREAPVQSAGQLPSGFDPAVLYPSRNHPRALQLTLYGASAAIN